MAAKLVFIPLSVIIIIFALMMAVSGLMLATVSVPLSEHAVDDHPYESDSVKSCLSKNGPMSVYAEKDGITFHFLCRMSSGKIGDQIIEVKDGAVRTKTAFIPKDGTWGKVWNWLQNKGVDCVKGEKLKALMEVIKK